MTTNLAMIADLSRPGAYGIFGDYDTYEDEWSEIYTKHHSDMAQENTVQVKFLPLASEIAEGTPFPTADMESRYTTTFYHKTFGMTFVITQNAIEDNLYQREFPETLRRLKKSLRETKNTVSMIPFNNAFDPALPLADGKPLISLSHPTDYGPIANGFSTVVDLSEGAVEALSTLGEKFRDLAGILCHTKIEKLIVPPSLSWTAERLTGSVYRTGTNLSDISAIYSRGTIPKGYRVNHYLTDENAYFFLTNEKQGFKHFVKKGIEIDMYTDFASKNLLTSAHERYSFGNDDWRALLAGGRAAV